MATMTVLATEAVTQETATHEMVVTDHVVVVLVAVMTTKMLVDIVDVVVSAVAAAVAVATSVAGRDVTVTTDDNLT